MILDNNDETPRPKANTSDIIKVNLVIVLVYTMLVNIVFFKTEIMNMIYNCWLVAGHTLICVLIGLYFLFSSKTSEGQAYLLAALIVLVVGFSSCLGGGALSLGTLKI